VNTSQLGAAYFAQKAKLGNPIVVSPDAGAEKQAKIFVEAMKKYPGYENLSDPAVIIKHRLRAGEVADTKLLGDVTGKDCIVVDDICDSGGTLMASVDTLKKNGANSVRAFITHGLFSGAFYENLEKSSLTEMVTSDSIPILRPELESNSKVTRVPLSKL